MDLAGIIAGEIRAGGPIPFHRFMELALYHPELGYYTGPRDPFGKRGDFFTNSQLQPVFGRLIAQRLERWRDELGSSEHFAVLELGAGRGETGAQVRRCMPDVKWIPVEAGDAWPDRKVTGAVLCNEFFDALPVDVVERRGAGWVEWGVGLSPGGFEWRETGRRPETHGVPEVAEGQRTETCERQVRALKRILGILERGWVLVIDYGYERDEIERGGRFPSGSLMSYANHRADPEVLLRPGRRDITAHVNFSALADTGRAAGLEVSRLRTQRDFLLEVGQSDGFAFALAADGDRRALELRMQLKTLLFGLGETFRVLAMRKP